MSNPEEDKMVEWMRSEYRPDELMPGGRQALHTAIQSRISPNRKFRTHWMPAFAGAAVTAALAFLFIGNGTTHPPTVPGGSTVLAEELLLGMELLEGSSLPLPEEFDAISAVFLGS